MCTGDESSAIRIGLNFFSSKGEAVEFWNKSVLNNIIVKQLILLGSKTVKLGLFGLSSCVCTGFHDRSKRNQLVSKPGLRVGVKILMSGGSEVEIHAQNYRSGD
jgi:hypothetical protein